MKKKFIKLILYCLICLGGAFQVSARSASLQFSEPDFRNMPLGSYIKGIYTIQEDISGGDYLKHRTDDIGSMEALNPDDTRFYFWIIENRYKGYFQVYSASEKGAILQIKDDGVPVFTNELNSERSSLLFRMSEAGPNTTDADKSDGIVAKGYITTVSGANDATCDCKIMTPVGSSKRFIIRKVDFDVNMYYPITFEKADPILNANKGNIEEDLANRRTRIYQINNNKRNNFVSSKFFVGGYGSDDFRITIASGTEGTVGFVDYIRHNLMSSTYDQAIPKVGIKIHNGVISLIFGQGGQELPRSNASLFGGEIATDFVFGVPITFGFEGQQYLVASQNGKEYRLPLNDPTEFFMNQSISQNARMLVQLEQGEVQLSYTLKNALVNLRSDFGGNDGSTYYSSDAFFPHSPDGEIVNTFDWTQTKWPIRYRDAGIQEEEVFSPFYQSGDFYNSISAKYDQSTGAYQGGEDFSYNEGWELIKADLGYNADGTIRSQAPLLPYVMLYDRVLGMLRVMVYTKNEGEANQLILSLNTDSNNKYRPQMWGGMAQFASLDRVKASSFSQPMTFFSSSGRQWYFADFYMEFDPCVCFFESNFTLEAYKQTKGDLSIIGRLSGGSIPAGTDPYDDWTSHREDYLMSVMDNDFGSLENTLGTTVFNQYDQFDLVEYSNEINGVLVGKKIEKWEKEAAWLTWRGTKQDGNSQIASGTFTIAEGAATIVEGAAKMMDSPILGFASKKVEGAAKIAQGVAKIGKGSATIARGEAKLKVASARKLQYDAIKDKVKRSDQKINLKEPDPRPHVVFGDLALKGTLTISTKMLRDGDGRIVTPGGQNPCDGPGCEWYNNGLLGGTPLYDRPLGNFNLLNQPKFGVAIVRNGDSFEAYLKIKEKPYFVYNNSAHGKIDDALGLTIQVQTNKQRTNPTSYQSAGIASSEIGYSTLIGESGGLVGEHDITDLIDWDVILENLNMNSNIESELENWITVSYGVSSLTLTTLIDRSLNRSFANGNFIYEGETHFAYKDVGALGQSVWGESKKLANSNTTLASYGFVDHPLFGTNYNIYHSNFDKPTGELRSAMNSYCQNQKTAQANSAREVEELEEPVIEEELELEEGILIYPNPSDWLVNFRLTKAMKGETVITLYDLDGTKLIETVEQLVDGYQLEGKINIHSLSSGIYILRVKLPNGELINRKIIRK
ncbi:T9SS type A sorting domain-containing protein [Reichenbachiella versicolor]|uniref:T9SS type A sorting domain-containing protein n=1 Tax=Reichenbachiella versicolor TaxID=1821036 RepID=UPI000D6E56F7|nr:T9SS type A sorting domain-containing protein [Reichenbachiella versicolor]